MGNTWNYFLRNKSKFFNKFKEFKALVKNQTEKKIKVLRKVMVELGNVVVRIVARPFTWKEPLTSRRAAGTAEPVPIPTLLLLATRMTSRLLMSKIIGPPVLEPPVVFSISP